MNGWISIRNQWPESSGEYMVRDCRHDVFGTAKYDGHDWEEWKPVNNPHSGSLLLVTYYTTHWKPMHEISGWKKIEEELPGDRVRVLVYDRGGRTHIDQLIWYDDNTYEWFEGDRTTAVNYVWWRTLPEGPENE